MTTKPVLPADFDTWQQNPYTKVLMKSIKDDYVPRAAAERLQKELAEAKADAQRYRWLRDTPSPYLMVVMHVQDEGGSWTEYTMINRKLDASIDAARNGGKDALR